MQTSLRQNQSGLAAITVTLIILGIVTLITVGFATLMRREQRQALDQQLSTQAFYAAESGVNEARTYIDANASSLNDVSSCEDTPNEIMQNANVGNNASFSCVLMDVTPTELKATISPDRSWVVKAQTENGAPVNRLEISWQMPDNQAFAEPDWSDSYLFLSQGKWGERTSPLRLMLMPDVNDRTDLISRTFQAFLYPNADAGNSVNWTVAANPNNSTDPAGRVAGNGRIIDGNCDVTRRPYYCRVYLRGLSSSSYYLRLKTIYQPSVVSVRSFNDSNQLQELRNGQAKIDATGKAADVVRRIQVNVPLASGTFPYPEYALETFDTLCKRFITWPGGARSDWETSNGALELSDAQKAACNP